MGYEALILLAAALVTLPFALSMSRRARRNGSRRVGNRVGCLFISILLVLLTLSGLSGYFYPYGMPGREVPNLRVNAEECAKRYASARSKTDSAAVDVLILGPDSGSGFSCGTLRRNRLPGCQPGSRCARFKALLKLPESR
jgi:hypothetical protein